MRYTNMYLPVLFYFLNFCVRPTVQKRAVLALAAGIKCFGPPKFFWQGFFTLPIFLILRTFFGVYSKNGETNILKIFNLTLQKPELLVFRLQRLELKCDVKTLCPRYTIMTLPDIFYFTNFFSCLFKKRSFSFSALAAGIKM